jgi:hypothetical protein
MELKNGFKKKTQPRKLRSPKGQRGEIWSEKIITNDYANGYKNIIDFFHDYHKTWVQFIHSYYMD